MFMQAVVYVPAFGEPVALALSWMLTYLIHSTILVLSVWLICRGIKPLAKRIGPSGENLGWKLALVGAFVSASVQVAAGVSPVLGALELEAGPKVVERAPALESQPHRVLRTRPVIVDESEVVMLGAGPGVVEATGPSASEAIETEPAPLWPKLIVGAWLLGAVIALARLGGSVVALRRKLADRRAVIEDPVLESFLTLCRDVDIRRKIRLTASPSISSPIALWRSEIVIPQRAVEELSPAAMRSVLAHEIAHLERRDPHWLALAAVIEALCFFQPLNRLARRGMQESAELLCDDWAIARTGDGVQFAKSLAELASWNAAAPMSVLVAGMLGERPLVRRVERALDGDPRRLASDDGSRPTRVLLGLGTLAALIMVAPGAVDASPPKAVENGDKADRKTRKSEAKAERDATKAAERARDARARAEQALREAEEAEREAADAARAAQPQLDQQAAGNQHMIIRDGDDYLIVDENGVRMRADGAEVEIIDGANPRMKIRMHEDGVDLDLDVDLDTLSGLAEMLLGGAMLPPPGMPPHAPGVPHAPGAPHAPSAPHADMDAWAQDIEAFAEQFEGQLGEEFGADFEEMEEMLEQHLREFGTGFPQHRMPAPVAPTAPVLPSAPSAPFAPPAPPASAPLIPA
jgi:beta-lactamase regulating signal transducer with metallopeptidase domain